MSKPSCEVQVTVRCAGFITPLPHHIFYRRIKMNLNSIINKKIAVHCPTKELSEKFLTECQAAGFRVDNTDRSYWYRYECKTCYSLHGSSTTPGKYKEITFCQKECYEIRGFYIIEYNKEEPTMSKFKPGDRVIAKKGAPYAVTTNGWIGVVTSVNYPFIRVTGSEFPSRDGGAIVESKYFDLLPDEKIIVTANGKTTTAKLYNGKTVVKTAEAKCSPDDEFNFLTGAHLAVSRLCGVNSNVKSGEPECKIKPGDFVKIIHTECHHFPLGTIVEVKFVEFDSLYCYGLLRNPYNDNKYEFAEQIVWIEEVEPV